MKRNVYYLAAMQVVAEMACICQEVSDCDFETICTELWKCFETYNGNDGFTDVSGEVYDVCGRYTSSVLDVFKVLSCAVNEEDASTIEQTREDLSIGLLLGDKNRTEENVSFDEISLLKEKMCGF